MIINHRDTEDTKKIIIWSNRQMRSNIKIVTSVFFGVPGRSLADLSDCKESDMLIARSACSCGLPCRATEHGQQAGFQPLGSKAKVRRTHRTTKARALTIVNPIRPRYTNLAAANLPEMVKPATCGEATSDGNRRTPRGDRGERARKDASRNLGDPLRPGDRAGGRPGINNRKVCCSWESERPIVAKKPWKQGGAKGPCCG